MGDATGGDEDDGVIDLRPTPDPAATNASSEEAVPAAGRLEPAQLVWWRAVELSTGADPSAALELVRLARHEPSVLRHARSLGRPGGGLVPSGRGVEKAVALLEQALVLIAGRDHRATVATDR
jgi:hypothetical protein